MAAPCEYPIILAVLGSLAGGMGARFVPMLEMQRAQVQLVEAHRAGDGDPEAFPVRVRYGWGRREAQWVVCEASRGGCRRALDRTPASEQARLVGLGLGAAGAAGLVARAIRRRRRELLEREGVDEWSEPGGYRAGGVARRVLPPVQERWLWKRVRWGLAPWLAALAVAATFGSGAALVPMPWMLLAWGAATLPPALIYLRWRDHVFWAPFVTAIAALTLALSRSFLAAGPALLILLVCSLCAGRDEASGRRS